MPLTSRRTRTVPWRTGGMTAENRAGPPLRSIRQMTYSGLDRARHDRLAGYFALRTAGSTAGVWSLGSRRSSRKNAARSVRPLSPDFR